MWTNTLLKKSRILILLSLLFLYACQGNNMNQDLIKLPYNAKAEIEVDDELLVSQELSDCNFAIASQNGNYFSSGNDSIPGYRIIQRAFNYLGASNDDRDIVGVIFKFDYPRNSSSITASEVEEFINEFSAQSLDQSFIFPVIKIRQNETIYSTIKYSSHLSELKPENFDKNATTSINQMTIDETYYCNQEKANVTELLINYTGKLYNSLKTDSIRISANYSMILE